MQGRVVSRLARASAACCDSGPAHLRCEAFEHGGQQGASPDHAGVGKGGQLVDLAGVVPWGQQEGIR